MNIVYIAIGSNLDNPIKHAKAAIKALAALPKSKLICASSLYISKPMGEIEQGDYINAVAKIATTLSPLELLDATQNIENIHGRKRCVRWGARTLDLDILLYGNELITTERLTIPHYGMQEREFVIYPLLEIEPLLVLPNKVKLKSLTSKVALNSMVKLSPENE